MCPLTIHVLKKINFSDLSEEFFGFTSSSYIKQSNNKIPDPNVIIDQRKHNLILFIDCAVLGVKCMNKK